MNTQQDTIPPTMHAIVHTEFGSPENLFSTQVSIPPLHSTQVLLRVHAASVSPVDCSILAGNTIRTLPYCVIPTPGNVF